jgi:hypothetical protein
MLTTAVRPGAAFPRVQTPSLHDIQSNDLALFGAHARTAKVK